MTRQPFFIALENRSFGVLACVELSFDTCTCISCRIRIRREPLDLVALDLVSINVARGTLLIISLSSKIPGAL